MPESSPTPPPPHVYAAINAVQLAMSREGIAKASKNTQQGYAFRGIDQVYGALAPHLAMQGLCILPRVITRETTERTTKNGGVLFYTNLQVEFDFVSMKDGSKHVVATVGEAMDSADKSSNKAMSAAYKYACFMAFSIPTEGENDADGQTYSDIQPGVQGNYTPVQGQTMTPPPAPITEATTKTISAMLGDGDLATLVDKSLAKLGVIALSDLSENEGQMLLEALKKKQLKKEKL